MHFSSILVLVVPLILPSNTEISAPEVQLPHGRIQGTTAVTARNTTYYFFAKIPYAAAPVGSLRFQPPVPPPSWSGTLDATNLNVSCYQDMSSSTNIQSEDCLFINVATPKLPGDGGDVKLPVLFFIHGGFFVSDSSIRYMKSDGIIEDGVILVTFNYRLGVFGFLSTEDDVIPGNNGLKDQKLALLWTRENIHLFGGDPEKITMYGQSAGAMSCGYHLLHSYSGTFKGAILESGSSLTPMAYQRSAKKRAFWLGTLLDLSFFFNRNSHKLLSVLQTVDAPSLRDASSRLNIFSFITNPSMDWLQGDLWAPVLEKNRPGAFITEKPYKQLQKGTIEMVPLLIGFNSEEALLLNQIGFVENLILLFFDLRLDLLVPVDMHISSYFQKIQIGNEVKRIYLKEHFFNILALNRCDGIRLISDTIFTRSVIKFAEMYSKFAETYLYEFAYDGQLGGLDTECSGAGTVSHSENLNYMFCAFPDCNILEYAESDQIAQKRLSKLWTNFAKSQNPTPEFDPLLQGISWPQVSIRSGDFLYLNINESLEVRNRPKNEVYPEWVRLYGSLENQDFDTY